MMNTWGYEGGFIMGPVVMLIFTILMVLPFWRICKKAGYNGAFSLFILIPIANMIFLYWLAFAKWPTENSERTERQ